MKSRDRFSGEAPNGTVCRLLESLPGASVNDLPRAFERVAQSLLHGWTLIAGHSSFRILVFSSWHLLNEIADVFNADQAFFVQELEFYFVREDHLDPFAHDTPLQATCAKWYASILFTSPYRFIVRDRDSNTQHGLKIK
jgi:hypothetical protein